MRITSQGETDLPTLNTLAEASCKRTSDFIAVTSASRSDAVWACAKPSAREASERALRLG